MVTFGSGNSATSSASVDLAGTYVLRWTVSKGICTSQDDVQVILQSPITTTITTSNVSCFGISDGKINVTAANGTAPYTVSKNNRRWIPKFNWC